MGMTSSEPKRHDDVLPADWDWWAVGQFARIITGPFGTLLKASEYSASGEGVPVISVGEIREGFFRIGSHTPRVSDTVTRRLPQFVLRAGDVVCGRKGSVDRSALVSHEEEGWFLGSDGISVRPTGGIDPHYLAYQFQSAKVKDWVLQQSTGTTMATLNQRILAAATVPVPRTVAEQEAIAGALSDADALVKSLERLSVKKRLIKQGVMQELLTGRRRLPGFEEEWQTRRLGDICDITMGATPPRKDAKNWGAGHVWLSIADMHGRTVEHSKEEITDAAAQRFPAVPKGTLLMSFKLSIGRLCFAGRQLYTNEAICAFRNLKAEARFLYYQLGVTDFSVYGKQAVKGYTLNSKSLRTVEVSLPMAEEQEAISALLWTMDDEIEALEQRLQKTRQVKQGMMQQLLAGRIRLV